MNRLAKRVGAATARRPWTTIIVWLLLVAASATVASLWGGTLTDNLVAPDSETEAAVELLEDRFPNASGASAVVVFKTETGAVTDPSAQAAISETLALVADLDHIGLYTDPFTTPGAISPDGTIARSDLLYDVPSTEVGREGAEALIDSLEPAREAGLQAEAGGELVLFFTQPETSTAEIVGILVALLILVLVFGSVVAALLPIAVAIVAIASGTSLLTWLASVYDISADGPVIATMIGLGVGIDYALLILARYREHRRAGDSISDSITASMATAGTAVVFAGGTVMIALLGLAFAGVGSLTSVGVSASIVVALSVAAGLTLLPALLSLLGDRIEKLRVLPVREPRGESAWSRWSHHVTRRPWRYMTGATAVLVALAIPVFSIELGYIDASAEPTTTTHRRAYDLISEGFGPGFNGPFVLVVDIASDDEAEETIADVTATAQADPGILAVGPPIPNEAQDTVLITVIPTTSPSDFDTADTVEHLRTAIDNPDVYVAGSTAALIDLADHLTEVTPIFIGAVLALSFLLLTLVFRSLLVPLKAVLMNLLAIAAAGGVIVAVFQWGWGLSLIGLEEPVPIISFVPIMLFAILFGLSMDYEVFLLSRIREEWIRTGDGHESVAAGIAGTGRVITSAAAIMIAVFLAFVATDAPILKMIGLGLAAAIFIDATIIRMVLVPSAMSLMGDANWWLPRWLDRVLPEIHLEGEDTERREETVKVSTRSE